MKAYVVGSKSFRPDHLFEVTEIKQICYFSTQSPFISTHFSTDRLTSPQMALYIPHSIFHLARLLYVRPETFGPYYVCASSVHLFASDLLKICRSSIPMVFRAKVLGKMRHVFGSQTLMPQATWCLWHCYSKNVTSPAIILQQLCVIHECCTT